jgi:hypothetical protein
MININQLRNSIYLVHLVTLLIVYFYYSLFTKFTFDRDHSDLKLDEIHANGSVIWQFIAIIARLFDNPFFVFYAINSLFFGSLLFFVAKKNPFQSISISLAFSIYAVLWWGLGQLRYGTAILMFLTAAIYSNSKLKVLTITLASSLLHTILLSSVFIYLISAIRSKSIQVYIILVIIASGIYFFVNDDLFISLIVNLLNIIGYNNYVGWIANEPTTTWAKVFAVGGALSITLGTNKRMLWILITITIIFLVFSLNPLFAGRAYTLYIGAIVPILLHQANKIKFTTKILLISMYFFEIYILFSSEEVLLDLSLLFA